MGLQQTEQRETCTDGPTLHPKPGMGIYWYRQGPGAETCSQRTDPGQDWG